jgi:hypothetical protein
MDPYTALANLKLAFKMEAERKRRLEQEEVSSKRKKMAELMSKVVSTSKTPQETSQGSTSNKDEEKAICFMTLSQMSQDVYGGLSKVYSEMLKIHAMVNNDETSRLMEYVVR